MKAIFSVIFLLFVFILLLVTPVKGSSDWEEFNAYKGKVYSYNKVNIKYGANDIVQVWVKTVYSNEGRERDLQLMRKQGLATAKEWDKLSDRLSLVELDCKKGMTRVISVTYYDSDGGILYRKSSDKQEWKAISSNSSFDILRKKICK